MKLGIRCDDGSSPKMHCLMFKVAGEINCEYLLFLDIFLLVISN